MRCLERWVLLNPNLLRPLLPLLFFFNFSFGTVLIELKEFSKVSSEKIYLEDIADIKTESLQFKNFLKEIEIDKSPKPKKTKIITKSRIISVLKTYHLDLTGIKIKGERCVVVSDFIKISKEQIIRDVEKFLEKKFKNIKIQTVSVHTRNIFVPKNYSKEVEIKSKSRSYIHLEYTISSPDKRISIPVSVKYSEVSSVVKAVRDIKRGRKITEEDIETVEMFNVRDGYVREPEYVIGKIAKVNIKRGSPIRENQIVPDYAVRKKDKVKVIYDRGIIRVELYGTALENGEIGSVIRVKNLSSRKEIRCKVIGRKEVLFIGD